jgi:DNA-binding MarR family transcriptional regulator
MELEKEIFSKSFESYYNKAIINIVYTYGWINSHLKTELDKFNLTHQQFNILRILRGQHPNPATINLLKERMLDKMSDASRIVDRLVQKEFVSRCINKKDRRAADITITKKGLAILEQIHLDVSMKNVLKNNLTEDEARELSDLLDKLRG